MSPNAQTAVAAVDAAETRHIPVLRAEAVAALAPQPHGVYLDGTFGGGGYARALLGAPGPDGPRAIGLDRDPSALEAAQAWRGLYGDRLTLVQGNFGDLDDCAAEAGAPALDGIVLDIGVSSMQIDQAERGFSFQKDGPLDMRMSQSGPSAADLINSASDTELADILYHYGEERRSRAIARAIVAARQAAPIETTAALANIVRGVLPRAKPGQADPATRSFQALRIAVNDELGALIRALEASERSLKSNGVLAIVTFHSLEDRIVKRAFQQMTGSTARPSRYAPAAIEEAPRFESLTRKAVGPSEAELAVNPRARSAKLRAVRRLETPARALDRAALGAPPLAIRVGRDGDRA